jgi:hypothetical protein
MKRKMNIPMLLLHEILSLTYHTLNLLISQECVMRNFDFQQ